MLFLASYLIGLDAFADKPSEASDHIRPLLKFAASYVPTSKHKETPVYIMATAGLRMLDIRYAWSMNIQSVN